MSDIEAWEVYRVTSTRTLIKVGAIQLPTRERIFSSLPLSVQQLITALDTSMGQDTGGGTYHPISETRFCHFYPLIRLIAQRPHALPPLDMKAYNTEAEVTQGLQRWAAQGSYEQRLWKTIQRMLPQARKDLALYYETHHHLPSFTAKTYAYKAIMDLYKTPYAFSKRDLKKKISLKKDRF
ncbi:hypothetical protein [Candidatus Hepatobacter penaei]|uniref:hypothetical protein n=1 Tax=Candidatus Hepatobacter penaei TaxID=1274402 RepID=UPI0012E021B3|nr:hypothetical protein [Candidatus Hepatobacter penaei]